MKFGFAHHRDNDFRNVSVFLRINILICVLLSTFVQSKLRQHTDNCHFRQWCSTSGLLVKQEAITPCCLRAGCRPNLGQNYCYVGNPLSVLTLRPWAKGSRPLSSEWMINYGLLASQLQSSRKLWRPRHARQFGIWDHSSHIPSKRSRSTRKYHFAPVEPSEKFAEHRFAVALTIYKVSSCTEASFNSFLFDDTVKRERERWIHGGFMWDSPDVSRIQSRCFSFICYFSLWNISESLLCDFVLFVICVCMHRGTYCGGCGSGGGEGRPLTVLRSHLKGQCQWFHPRHLSMISKILKLKLALD